jgi:hypothetical protein
VGTHGGLPTLGAHRLILASLLAVAAVGGSPWSAPAALPGACSTGGPPHVVFPSNAPDHRTGPGAIVWDSSPTCPGGEGARVDAIGADDRPAAPTIPLMAAGHTIAPRGALVVSPGPHGQIVIAGASPGRRAHALVVQGRAGGPFSSLLGEALPAAPLAFANGYLGDVALASPPSATGGAGASEGPEVHVERYFSNALSRRGTVSAATTMTPPPRTVALALDYRSDALVLWTQGGALYARDLPASGASAFSQLLARVGPHVRISALLSDNNRATVAWAEDHAGRTSVYLDRSATGVRFGAPRLLERFRDPDGLASPPGSPSLVRLSTESVVLAWAGAAGGHWVVRAAVVDASGVGDASTIAAPGSDALLTALAPGPDAEALALWTEPQPASAGAPNTDEQALFSALATVVAAGRMRFDLPEQVAPPEAIDSATAALDPDDDRAVAVWRGAGGQLRYAVRDAFSRPPEADPAQPHRAKVLG